MEASGDPARPERISLMSGGEEEATHADAEAHGESE
jgi:hypothetical protein